MSRAQTTIRRVGKHRSYLIEIQPEADRSQGFAPIIRDRVEIRVIGVRWDASARRARFSPRGNDGEHEGMTLVVGSDSIEEGFADLIDGGGSWDGPTDRLPMAANKNSDTSGGGARMRVGEKLYKLTGQQDWTDAGAFEDAGFYTYTWTEITEGT